MTASPQCAAMTPPRALRSADGVALQCRTMPPARSAEHVYAKPSSSRPEALHAAPPAMVVEPASVGAVVVVAMVVEAFPAAFEFPEPSEPAVVVEAFELPALELRIVVALPWPGPSAPAVVVASPLPDGSWRAASARAALPFGLASGAEAVPGRSKEQRGAAASEPRAKQGVASNAPLSHKRDIGNDMFFPGNVHDTLTVPMTTANPRRKRKRRRASQRSWTSLDLRMKAAQGPLFKVGRGAAHSKVLSTLDLCCLW